MGMEERNKREGEGREGMGKEGRNKGETKEKGMEKESGRKRNKGEGSGGGIEEGNERFYCWCIVLLLLVHSPFVLVFPAPLCPHE